MSGFVGFLQMRRIQEADRRQKEQDRMGQEKYAMLLEEYQRGLDAEANKQKVMSQVLAGKPELSPFVGPMETGGYVPDVATGNMLPYSQRETAGMFAQAGLLDPKSYLDLLKGNEWQQMNSGKGFSRMTPEGGIEFQEAPWNKETGKDPYQNINENELRVRKAMGDPIASAVVDHIDKMGIAKANAGAARIDASGARSDRSSAIQLGGKFEDTDEIKSWNKVAPNHARMESAYNSALKGGNNVANDQTLIMTFNKLLDEQSVVRESEYARMGENLALWNQIKGSIEKKLQGGAGLTNEERQVIFNAAGEFYSIAKQRAEKVASSYEKKAEKFGLDKSSIVDRELLFGATPPGGAAIKFLGFE